MKLQITRETVFEGKRVIPGDIVEAKNKFLVNIKKAVLVTEESQEKPFKKRKKKPDQVEND